MVHWKRLWAASNMQLVYLVYTRAICKKKDEKQCLIRPQNTRERAQKTRNVPIITWTSRCTCESKRGRGEWWSGNLDVSNFNLQSIQASNLWEPVRFTNYLAWEQVALVVCSKQLLFSLGHQSHWNWSSIYRTTIFIAMQAYGPSLSDLKKVCKVYLFFLTEWLERNSRGTLRCRSAVEIFDTLVFFQNGCILTVFERVNGKFLGNSNNCKSLSN